MRLSIVTASVLALASTALVAQNATPPAHNRVEPSSQNFRVAIDAPSSCPVSLHALQGAGTGLVAVRDAKPAPGSSQRIHLVLSDTAAAPVVSAKVIVRGLSGQIQIVQTRSNHRESSDAAKTLDVQFMREDEKTVAADLILPGFTSVSSVELESIRYDDESTWRVAGHATCRVAPDPFMLVAGR
jgi:hypothetical protein